jgi:hypothetical protein
MIAAKSGNAHLAALKQVSLMVQREALTLTYNDVFFLRSLAFFIAVPLTFFLARPKIAADAAGH